MGLGLDWRYLMRHGSWVAGGQTLAYAAGLVGSVAMARLTTPVILGQYQYVTALIGFFSVAALTGMNLPVMKAVVAGNPRALLQAYRLSLRTSFIAVPILFLIAFYQWRIGQNEVSYAVLAGSLIFPLTYAPRAWSAFYEAKQDFSTVASRVVVSAWLLVAALLFGLLLQASVLWLIVIWAGVQALLHNYYLWQIARHLPIAHSDPLDWRLGLTMTAQKFSQSITSTLPAIAVAWFFTFEQVAHFSIALYLLTFAVSLSFAAMSVFLPLFFAADTERDSWWRVCLANILVGLIMAVLFAAGTKLLFQPLYGPAYATSLAIIWWLLPTVVFFPLKAYVGHFLTANGYNLSQIVVNVFGHLLGIILLAVWHDQISFVLLMSWYYCVLILVPLFPLGWLFHREWSRSTKDQPRVTDIHTIPE